MSREYESEIAAFIRAKGVTRCPTVCLVPTQGSTDPADRAALRRRAEHYETVRQERAKQAWVRGVSAA